MRVSKTEIRLDNNKLIKLKSRHYEIMIKRPVIESADTMQKSLPQVQKASR